MSGAVYGIDMDALTWERVGRVPIVGTDRNSGRLSFKPTLSIGATVLLQDTLLGPIRTTPVVLLEVVEN